MTAPRRGSAPVAGLIARVRQAARLARRRRALRPDPLCPQCGGSGTWETGSGRVWISGGEVYEDSQPHGRPGRRCPVCWCRPTGPRPDRALLEEEITRREALAAESLAAERALDDFDRPR